MKIEAKVVPWSSVVGTGIMLLDETGAITAQLAMMNASTGRTPEEMVAFCERIAAAINAGQHERRIHHPGRGSDYDVLPEATFQVSTPISKVRLVTDGDPVTVYRNEHGVFVRFPDEMVEPRFKEIKS